jgi:Domain of unknown function (DUF4252)
MHNQMVIFILAAATLAGPAFAQTAQLPAPSPIEKELAARASDVTEVTLGKNMLNFAAKVMNGKDDDDAEARHLIEGLQGIYVREYEFEKEGEYTVEQIDQLRKYYETSEWTPMVHEHNKKTGETSDVMVKLVNGESNGMFILDVEPKEVSIVLILGTIHMDDLGKLKGISGLSELGDLNISVEGKDKEKDKDKDKSKDKKGGAQ